MCLMSFQSLLKTEIYRLGNTSSIPYVASRSHFQISKYLFDIRCDIGKLEIYEIGFFLSIPMSLLDLTF